MMADRGYLTRQEVVDRTALSLSTIDRAIRAGALPV